MNSRQLVYRTLPLVLLLAAIAPSLSSAEAVKEDEVRAFPTVAYLVTPSFGRIHSPNLTTLNTTDEVVVSLVDIPGNATYELVPDNATLATVTAVVGDAGYAEFWRVPIKATDWTVLVNGTAVGRVSAGDEVMTQTVYCAFAARSGETGWPDWVSRYTLYSKMDCWEGKVWTVSVSYRNSCTYGFPPVVGWITGNDADGIIEWQGTTQAGPFLKYKYINTRIAGHCGWGLRDHVFHSQSWPPVGYARTILEMQPLYDGGNPGNPAPATVHVGYDSAHILCPECAPP